MLALAELSTDDCNYEAAIAFATTREDAPVDELRPIVHGVRDDKKQRVAMMEPASLATAAVGLLVTYLRRLGGEVAEEAALVLDEVVLGHLRRLFEVVKRRVIGERYAGQALERVEAHPGNERRQGALEDALLDIVEVDGGFAAELSALVEEIESAAGNRIDISDAGAVSIGGRVVIKGRYAAGRDMTIGQPPSDAER